MEIEKKYNQNVAYDDTLDIQDIILMIKKNITVIIVFVLLGTALGFAYGEYKDIKDPQFTASASILVTADNNNIVEGTTTQYQLSYSLMDTYCAFIKENVVMDKVVKAMNESYGENRIDNKMLKQNFTTATSANSLIINTTYTAESPKEAVETLNCVLETAVDTADALDSNGEPVYKLLNRTISILTPATEEHIVNPSKLFSSGAIGFVIGVALAVVYVVLKKITDNRYESVEDVERTLDIPVLAGIPEYSFKKD